MTIRSAVTISLVPEAQGGPFVFWDDLSQGCEKAAELGFDAVEIFAPSPAEVDPSETKPMLEKLGLKVAAVGTGAGMVIHRLSLTDPDAETRTQAKTYVRKMIDLGAVFAAPAIIGSMQGRYGREIDKATALSYLREALNELGEHSATKGVPLIYEPLNRYESNLVNTVADGVELLKSLSTTNVKLLADLFHMNIEESNLPQAIQQGKGYLGHVHFVDSNRRPVGLGHTEMTDIAAALREIGYEGYLSAEAFPYPDSDAAAKQTIDAFQKYFPR